MKKIKLGKLSLSTETLAPLTGEALDNVAGGQAAGAGAGAAATGLIGRPSQPPQCINSCFCPPPTLRCLDNNNR
jgi:hypothetical protein